MTRAMTPPRIATPTSGRSIVLALVCAAQFMVIPDASIVNVALPAVRADLGFTASGVAWVVNGYLLTFAGLMLLGGRAADLFGPRRVLTAGLALFALASLAAGLATTPGVLVAARLVQGAGAALMAPATLAIINTRFPDAGARAKAFGAWSASGGVGGMAGAVLGGVITTGLSWRWVFLINVPLGMVLVVLAASTLGGPPKWHPQPLDLTGVTTGTAGLAAVVYAVMQTAEHGWASGHVLVPLAAGAVLLAVFAAVEARFAAQPLMPVRLFAVQGVLPGTGMLLLLGAVSMGLWYFSSLFLQNVMGFSALAAGLGQTPAAVLFVVVARWAAAAVHRTGARALVFSGSAALAIGFAWLSHASADSTYLGGVLGPTLLIAAGIGLTFPTLMALATAAAPEGDAGVVGGLANTASQVGGSAGLAILATAAAAAAGPLGDHPSRELAHGYDVAFLIAAALSAAIAAVGLLHRPAPGPPRQEGTLSRKP